MFVCVCVCVRVHTAYNKRERSGRGVWMVGNLFSGRERLLYRGVSLVASRATPTIYFAPHPQFISRHTHYQLR